MATPLDPPTPVKSGTDACSMSTGSNDNQNQRLTTMLLNEQNYLPWSRAVTIALGGRSKLGYVDGRIKAPPPNDPKFEEWQAQDHGVMSLLFNSMEPRIYEIFAYSNTAKQLWDSLHEMYGQANNAARIFELQQGISKSQQGPNQTFTEHLGHMKKQWDELRLYRPPTHDVSTLLQREEQDRIFQLLASIKQEFDDVKRQVLMSPQLPSFTTVCAMIQGEETRRRIMNPIVDRYEIEHTAHAVTVNSKSADSVNKTNKGKNALGS